MTEQLSSFANAQHRNEDQKRALLAAIAEAGTAGAEAHKQAQAEIGAGRNQAVQAAAQRAGAIEAPAEYIAQARSGAAAGYDMRSADMSQGQATFQQDIARQRSGNVEYMDRLGAAIPLVESRTRAAVEQIIREQEAAREAQAMDMEMKRLGLETAKTNLSASKSRGGGEGLSVSEQIALAKYQDSQAKTGEEKAMEQSRKFVLQKLQSSASPNTTNAFMTAVSGAKDITEALARIRGGYAAATGPEADPKAKAMFKGVSVPKLEDWVRRYFQPSQEELGMALGLVPVPTPKQVGPSIMGAKIMRAQ